MKAHRMLVTLGMALASAVVLAAGVQAAERADDRGGMLGVGATQVASASPDAFERAVLRATEAASPDAFERAVLRQATVTVRPDDRADTRGPGSIAQPFSAVPVTAASGFQWSDALLGAAGTLGVLLLAMAATLTIRHRSRIVLR